METTKAFKIGTCLIQPVDFSVQFEHAQKITIQPKYIEVITYLAFHHPRIIPRDELIEKIWNGNHYSGDKALTNTIWHVRQCLSGANGKEDVIETIRKVGYRLFLAPVWEEDTPKPLVQPQQQTAGPALIGSLRKWDTVGLYLIILILLIIGIGSFYSSTPQQPAPFSEHITREPGIERFVAASPNGRYLAYSWINPHNQVNLYLTDRQQPQLLPKQLTFDDAIEGHSVWSNSGKFIYFSRKNLSTPLCEIVQLNIATNQERHITSCPLKVGYNYIDISPDDKTLAFYGHHQGAEKSGIYFIALDETHAKPVRFSCAQNCKHKDRDMAFSPDGKRIAITRRISEFNENIYLINLSTSEETQLTFEHEDITGLTWHKDGRTIIYGAQKADKIDGYVLDSRTKQSKAMKVSGFSYPSYAKKSSELFYHHKIDKHYIAHLKLNSEVATSPFPLIYSEFSHRYPDYSDKANKVVYVSNESGFYELWLADADGDNRTQLTHLQRSVYYPRWSHKGDKVAFLAPSDNKDGDRIYVVDILSKQLSMLATGKKLHNRPTWSFDDSSVITAIYSNEPTDLYQFSIVDGKSKRLTFNGGRYGVMISPTTLLYTGEKRGLWQLEIDSSTAFEKLNRETFDSRYAWVYKNQGLYFRQDSATHHQFMHYDFNLSKLTPLVRLPKEMAQSYREISINKNKDELLFTSNQYPYSDIKKLYHPLLPN